ncbi:MAG: C39 family peptidase [Sporomusaceae bacterium]|nr:C39 family peptidase [Sporomusaceae bacterium]
MRNKVWGTVLLAVTLGVYGVFGAGVAAASGEIANSMVESSVIPYPSGFDTTKEGASAYQGIGNVKNSPYYTKLDFYHMKSSETLTILTNYKTYQQTTEITCGPAAALTVLYHFDNTSWNELEIAKIMGTKPEVGTDTKGMVTFFKKIGWDVKSSLTSAGKDGTTFASPKEFKDFVVGNLKENTPVLVENIDWGGHWRAIIGYDTLGTDTVADDVVILADSYDTADHWQDGYVIMPAEKFFYMWFDAHMLPKDQQRQQWLVAKPSQL